MALKKAWETEKDGVKGIGVQELDVSKARLLASMKAKELGKALKPDAPVPQRNEELRYSLFFPYT